MKRIICSVCFLVFLNCLFAQESVSDSKFGIYIKGSLVHSYSFDLNNTLGNMGCKKIPDVLTAGVWGISYNIKKVEMTLDMGIEGHYSNKTRLLNFIANTSVGYELMLQKKHSLIFAGNIAYNIYNVFANIEKGNLDFENATLTNATMFHLELQQLMIGPKITWRNKICDVSIGYDIGCIPLCWTSNSVNILNSPKERIDRIHFDLAIYFAKY